MSDRDTHALQTSLRQVLCDIVSHPNTAYELLHASRLPSRLVSILLETCLGIYRKEEHSKLVLPHLERLDWYSPEPSFT